MKRKALLIGINYPNTPHQLKGCVNDVLTMRDILTTHYSFDPVDIKIVTDDQATTKNIFTQLEWLVNDLVPGDTVFFHYSGHGSQVYNKPGKYDIEQDGVDEILCPIDLDWVNNIIKDDDLKEIFDRIPTGCFFTTILDCCNSGTGMDHDHQYQPQIDLTSPKSISQERNRYLPPPQLMIDQMNDRTTTQQAICHRNSNNRNINDTGVMISGCRANQTSADANINGTHIGACTYYLSKTLQESNYNITYKLLVEKLNNKLAVNGYTQRPELNGNPLYHSQFFLQGSTTSIDKSSIVKYNTLPQVKTTIWSKIRNYFFK